MKTISTLDKWYIYVIWNNWAVWIQLKKMLEEELTLKDRLSPSIPWLSQMPEDDWEKQIFNILTGNEVVVLCTPDIISEKIIKLRQEMKGDVAKIIDCSTQFRCDPRFVYGLPELKDREKDIQKAELVANPWCHATAAILWIRPLVESGLVLTTTTVGITSLTWYSWWWKQVIAEYERKKAQNEPYPPLQYSNWEEPHKHTPEIEQQTGTKSVLQPTIENFYNGLKVNAFLQTTDEWEILWDDELVKVFKKYYDREEFIKVSKFPNDGKISMSENNGTQTVSIYVKKHNGLIQITVVLDNMTKWSAWAVIQNLNIMFWLPQGTWLTWKK